MMLEEKANNAYGAYEEQLNTKARLEEDIVTLKVEREALVKQIEAEQGNLSQYHDKQAKMNSQKDAAEKALVSAGEKLTAMEANRQQATADKKALEQENVVIKKDIEDLELAIQKLEQEKTNRDHQIRSLNDEIANQDEVINKLNKEKKHAGETSSKASEDLLSVEEKVAHMSNIKSKLSRLSMSSRILLRGRRGPVLTLTRTGGRLRVSSRLLRNLWLTWSASRRRPRTPLPGRRRTCLLSLPSLMMNSPLLPRPRRPSRRSRAALRSWKRSWRLSAKPGLRLRGRGLTLPGSLSSLVSVWERPEVPLPLRLSSTRRERLRSTS